jgi:hypothetical protein
MPGKIDHDITKVVSGIATTAISPRTGADETARLLSWLMARRAARPAGDVP